MLVWIDFKNGRAPAPTGELAVNAVELRYLHEELGWGFRLWTEDRIEALIASEFPDYMPTWSKLTPQRHFFQ